LEYVVEFGFEERRCKWWRLSFSAAEKDIILLADGEFSSTRSRTCRKDVLRLLKNDLSEFYRNNRFADEKVCSYYIKTIFLHLLEETTQSELWALGRLRCRYADALQRTASAFERGYIEHYFIAGENILGEKHIPKKELAAVKQYFLNKYFRYNSGNHS